MKFDFVYFWCSEEVYVVTAAKIKVPFTTYLSCDDGSRQDSGSATIDYGFEGNADIKPAIP